METDKQIRIHLCCKSGAFRQRYKFVIVTGPVCFYAGGGTVKIFSGKCINDLEINRFFFGTTVCCTEVFTAVSRIKNDNIFINFTGTIYCDEKIIALSGVSDFVHCICSFRVVLCLYHTEPAVSVQRCDFGFSLPFAHLG